MEGCPPLAASTRPDSSGLDAVESRPVDSFATLRSGLPCAPPRRPTREASRAASAGARSSTDQSPLVWHLPRCRITELSRRKKVPSCGKSPGAGGASASVCSQEANLNLSVPKRHCQGQRGTHTGRSFQNRRGQCNDRQRSTCSSLLDCSGISDVDATSQIEVVVVSESRSRCYEGFCLLVSLSHCACLSTGTSCARRAAVGG